MKTTKRSKMLLSSVAMLLVALVALGSATFAWYSINRTVGGDDLTVKASVPGGLQISDNGGSNWTTGTIEWSDTATLEPSTMSIKTSAPGYQNIQVSDSKSETSALSGASLVNAPLTADKYVLAKTVIVKNTNTVTGYIKGTLTNQTGQKAGSYMRCIVVEDGQSTAYADVVSNSATAAQTGSVFSLTQGSTKTFHIFTYADGTDEACTTNNAKGSDNVDIDFAISFEMKDATW